MKVKEAIKELATLDPEAELTLHYDGACRIEDIIIWECKSRKIALGETGSAIYYDKDRPLTAPSSKENKYYCI